jgi:hypothetical protein
MNAKNSSNDRAMQESFSAPAATTHGAELMNVKLLAATAAIAAFVVTGAQAQTAAPSQGTGAQQNGAMSGNSGATGQRLHGKGSKGTVGSATSKKKTHGGAAMKPAAPEPAGRSGTGAGSDDEN